MVMPPSRSCEMVVIAWEPPGSAVPPRGTSRSALASSTGLSDGLEIWCVMRGVATLSASASAWQVRRAIVRAVSRRGREGAADASVVPADPVRTEHRRRRPRRQVLARQSGRWLAGRSTACAPARRRPFAEPAPASTTPGAPGTIHAMRGRTASQPDARNPADPSQDRTVTLARRGGWGRHNCTHSCARSCASGDC